MILILKEHNQKKGKEEEEGGGGGGLIQSLTAMEDASTGTHTNNTYPAHNAQLLVISLQQSTSVLITSNKNHWVLNNLPQSLGGDLRIEWLEYQISFFTFSHINIRPNGVYKNCPRLLYPPLQRRLL